MKQVIVASTNPVKVRVAEKAFAAVFPGEEFAFTAVKSDSGVPDQPMEEETRHGAHNRLVFVRERHPDADFWISQEGGLHREGDRLFNRAWIAVCDKSGFVAESSTAQFYLPKQVAAYVEEGMELGVADDKFFGTRESSKAGGGIGLLTDGLIDRAEYYLQSAIIALSEIKHKEWY